MEFKHPKYYKELRSIRNKLDQVISCGIRRRPSTGRAPDPGLKLQAASLKQAIQETVPHCDIEEAASSKPQADSSIKLQASSPKQQASSSKPQASSSMIREPRNI